MIESGDRSEDRTACCWKHGKIAVLGLIGGIGSGKSRVAGILRERGALVIDADAVGHEVLGWPSVIEQIEGRFGAGVITNLDYERSRRMVDRRALASIVFEDPVARHDLEKIVHPLMRSRFESTIREAEEAGRASMIVLDAAILLEAGWAELCDNVVFVHASVARRMQRVALTRGWTEHAFQSRERAQWSESRKRARADYVINNDAGEKELDREIDGIECWLRDGCRPDDEACVHPNGTPAEFLSRAAGNGAC